jgi:Zn-dependent M28 family amino/carboxypeptidase
MKPDGVDSRRLEAHVKKLSVELSPRSFSDHENLAKVASYIEEELKRAGGDVTDQRYTTSDGSEYRNVIARFGPASEQLVVIGAHYDAYGGLPGADDNASGVAGLIELGVLLGKNPPKKTRVELVAYTLEEPPHFRTHEMGSAQHAQSLAYGATKVKAMLSLEMIGAFSDDEDSQKFPIRLLKLLYSTKANYIVVSGRMSQPGIVRTVKRAMRGASDLPVESINAPMFVRGVDFSDHLNYWKYGWDAAMVTDTAFYRNPRYHTAEDTWDTLDYPRMAKVVQGVFAATHALADD